jgi:hypothetical protein
MNYLVNFYKQLSKVCPQDEEAMSELEFGGYELYDPYTIFKNLSVPSFLVAQSAMGCDISINTHN